VNNLLEYPQYTKPRQSEHGNVPEVLLSGDHKKISNWRKKLALGKTFLNRRDLLERSKLKSEDIEILEEFLSELGYDSDRIIDLLNEIR
jgi:tRNA (guanine37-N1)-methyltransferase